MKEDNLTSLDAAHKIARGLYKADAITEQEMREYDELCAIRKNSTTPIGTLIDNIYDIKCQVDNLKREIQILESNKKDLEKQVNECMYQNGTTIAAGEYGKATITTKEVVSVTPTKWDDFFNYVFNTNSLHLLHKRISQTAALEILKNGEEIPGARIVECKKLSITTK